MTGKRTIYTSDCYMRRMQNPIDHHQNIEVDIDGQEYFVLEWF